MRDTFACDFPRKIRDVTVHFRKTPIVSDMIKMCVAVHNQKRCFEMWANCLLNIADTQSRVKQHTAFFAQNQERMYPLCMLMFTKSINGVVSFSYFKPIAISVIFLHFPYFSLTY